MGGGNSKDTKQLQETELKMKGELTRLVDVTHYELLTPAYIGGKLEELLQVRLTKEQQDLIRQHVEKVLSGHFKSQYKVHEVLGKGGYSVVHNCTRQADGSSHAVKVIDKQKLSKNALKSLKEEINTMRNLAHPRLIQLREVYDHGSTIYLVLERVEGGELFDEIVRLQKYTERTAAEVLFNFLDGLKYMHDQGYVHRDIKPENILLLRKHKMPEDVCADLKIADFGFAAHVGEDEPLTTCCGTPRYISPEVLNAGLFQKIKGYGKTCDMWATGVITYILLFGKAPFYHKDRPQLWHHITNGIWSMPPESDKLTPAAIDFIHNLLVVDRHKRFNVTQAITHPFIANRGQQQEQHLEEAMVNLREFNAREKFKAAIFGVQSLSRVAYIKKCLDLGVKANTGIMKEMDSGTLGDDTIHLDLTKNYVGSKGVCALLEMAEEGCPNLQSIDLTACSVNNTVVQALAQVAMKHPRLNSINLSRNPLSYTAGTLMLDVLKTNPRIKHLGLEDTKIQEGILRQINRQLELNKSKKMKDYFGGKKEGQEGEKKTKEEEAADAQKPPTPNGNSADAPAPVVNGSAPESAAAAAAADKPDDAAGGAPTKPGAAPEAAPAAPETAVAVAAT